MNSWLLKTEPNVYAFDDLVRDGKTTWDGVRSYPARLNLRKMVSGDMVFIYHSNIGKEVVGTAVVTTPAYPDKTDPEWVVVDITPGKPFRSPVTLATIKSTKTLSSMALVKQSRLSVSPVTAAEAKELLRLGGV